MCGVGGAGHGRREKKKDLHKDVLKRNGFFLLPFQRGGKKNRKRKDERRLMNSYLNNTCLRCNDFQLRHHGNICVF